MFSVKPVFSVLIVSLSLLLILILLSTPTPFSASSTRRRHLDIWSVGRIVEWRPCKWWLSPGHLTVNFAAISCYDFRVINNFYGQCSGFADVFDADYFINEMKGFVTVVKSLPEEISSREPVRVDCSKRKGHFDYIESVLPVLLEHHYISITPAARCYKALRLINALEKKGSELLDAIPKPFMSLHLRFEPDMVAYSQCEYHNLSNLSMKAIFSAQGERKPWTGETARIWRNRGKCPLTPNETALILRALSIPKNTTIYLAAGDGIMEIDGLKSMYSNVYTKSTLLSGEDFTNMHGNTKAALDYYVSINSDAYVATYFGNMDKMVSAMRAYKGLYKTLFLNRKAFAEFSSRGLTGVKLSRALWKSHRDDFIMGIGSALPDCFCESKL
ncbi:O-fucosyltransferase 13 [Ranunculus cassubicifolius]